MGEQKITVFPTDIELLAEYGTAETDMIFGAKNLTLQQVADMEADVCTADPEKRLDPEARVRWMASKITSSLKPEHIWLVEPASNEI